MRTFTNEKNYLAVVGKKSDDPDMKTMNALIDALQLAVEITQGMPDRSGEG